MSSLAQQLWEAAAAPLLAEMFGVSITYSRSGYSVAITATLSVVEYEIYDTQGGALNTTATVREYLIADEDLQQLATSGARFEPQRNDKITETINGVECTFHVAPVGGRKAADKQADGVRWLVRCKQVG